MHVEMLGPPEVRAELARIGAELTRAYAAQPGSRGAAGCGESLPSDDG